MQGSIVVATKGAPMILCLTVVLAMLVGPIGGILTPERSGAISGRLTDVHGEPAADLCVVAEMGTESPQRHAHTDADGNYLLTKLAPGDYTIRFAASSYIGSDGEYSECGPDRNLYRMRWYPAAASREEATLVTVTANQETAAIDGVLPTLGVITGRVTAPGGEPVAGACVRASGVLGTSTADDGTYRLPGIYWPEVNLWFEDCGDEHDLVSEWYGGAHRYPYGDDEPPADSAVSVADEEVIPNIDAQLDQGATLTVEVKGAELDEPYPDGVWVTLRPDEVRVAQATSSNPAVLDHMPPGRYYLRATGTRPNGEYFNEWHDGVEYFEDATPIDLQAGDNISLTMRIVGHKGCEVWEEAEDSDGDGVSDCDERKLPPPPRDSDDDRLTDEEETSTYHTDPLELDTDGDGFGDGFEVYGGYCLTREFSGGSDPNDPLSTPVADAGPSPTRLPTVRSSRVVCR